MAEDDPTPTLPGDNPIRDAEQDALDRAGVAEYFGRAVLTLDRSEGAVVGVFGPWGSGKTSFVNLARPTLGAGGATVIEFNPWMFSGAEQLVERFLGELSAELKLRDLKGLGDLIDGFSETFAVLPMEARIAAKVLGKALPRVEGGIAGRRRKVEEALRNRGDKPIVVVLDDVDRLSASEIRDIFKLVRLTASFPNLVYIVVCDRERVEQALGESGLSGRDYLEKIVQLPFDLPETPIGRLCNQCWSAIDHALSGIDKGDQFGQKRYDEIRRMIVPSLIRNMRDVRRYAAALQGTVVRLQGRVAITDVIALEALRIFEPDAFKLVYRKMSAITIILPVDSNNKPDYTLGIIHPQYSEHVQDLIEDIKSIKFGIVTDKNKKNNHIQNKDVIDSILSFLFLRHEFGKKCPTCAIYYRNLAFYFDSSIRNL